MLLLKQKSWLLLRVLLVFAVSIPCTAFGASDTETLKRLIRKISSNYRLPYFTITPTFSVCPTHGYLTGEEHHCPNCSQETEVYSRVVGYLRPIKQWNLGKQAEYSGRKAFQVA